GHTDREERQMIIGHDREQARLDDLQCHDAETGEEDAGKELGLTYRHLDPLGILKSLPALSNAPVHSLARKNIPAQSAHSRDTASRSALEGGADRCCEAGSKGGGSYPFFVFPYLMK